VAQKKLYTLAMKNTYYTPLCFTFTAARDPQSPTGANHRTTRTGGDWIPRADLVEDEKSYLIEVDLPGVAKDSVAVSYQDGNLTISGEREGGTGSQKFLSKERAFGRFSRTLAFGDDIDSASISAACKDGVLTVVVPKVEKKQPVKISVA
jgi:HSP20 family protein